MENPFKNDLDPDPNPQMGSRSYIQIPPSYPPKHCLEELYDNSQVCTSEEFLPAALWSQIFRIHPTSKFVAIFQVHSHQAIEPN